MSKFWKEVFEESKARVIDSEVQRMEGIFIDGYEQAAEISMKIITKKIEELHNQISSDSFLSEREQFLLLKLEELKSETEEELRDFWSIE